MARWRGSDAAQPLLLNSDPSDALDSSYKKDGLREDWDKPRNDAPPAKPEGKERLLSLDVFRGLTVVIMILVNQGPFGDPYVHFPHAEWNGLGLADVVMPFFLFMVGTSVVLAFRDVWPDPLSDDNNDNGGSGWFVRPAIGNRWPKVWKVIVRSIKLFLLGLICQGLRTFAALPFPYVDLAVIRIMGVLQRIAIVYLVTALAFLFVPPMRLNQAASLPGQAVQLLVRYLPLWTVGIAFGILYNVLLFTVYVPSRTRTGMPVECDVRGALTEDCNAADYIDSLILGTQHMYQPQVPHEPEGFVSTASAVGSAFAGLYFGIVLRYFRPWHWRVTQWVAATALLILAGVTIALATDVDINKKLYTVSYMFLTAGMAGGMLTFIYLTADVLGGRILHAFYFPLACVGMNAIMIYVGDSVLWSVTDFVYYEEPSQTLHNEFRSAVVGLFPDNRNDGLMLWAAIDATLWTLIAILLWWRKIFFKV